MDCDGLIHDDGLEDTQQNGTHYQLPVYGEDPVVSNVNADLTTRTVSSIGNPENDTDSHENMINNLSTGESLEGSNHHPKSDGLQINMGRAVDGNCSKQLKSQKGAGKSKIEKHSNSKNLSTTRVKKSKDGDASASTVSNGSTAPTARPRQELKSRSFNDRHAHPSKHEVSEEALSDGLREKNNLKPLRKGPPGKAEGDTSSSVTPTSADAKPPRVVALPNYGFSFRCYERAEKRKEFYCKLEEKIQAKEEEKNNLQAKSKESQEAEIKMLRKSLTFKATPLPSFYQEPPLPKLELKKIPPTRAKSPKLGRNKVSTLGDTEGDHYPSSRSIRLSLDEKRTQNSHVRGAFPILQKPQRNSLPNKLPYEKTTSSNARNKPKTTSAKPKREEKTSFPIRRHTESVTLLGNQDKAVPKAKLDETQPTDGGLAADDEAHPNLLEAPISVQIHAD